MLLIWQKIIFSTVRMIDELKQNELRPWIFCLGKLEEMC